MKNLSKISFSPFKWIVIIVLAVVLVLILIPAQASSITTPPVPSPPPPTYSIWMNKDQTTHTNPVGTNTPYPINNVIDLNPELDKFDKWEAIVLQTDGTYYEIWVGQGTNIKLKNNDDKVISMVPSASMMSRQPIAATAVLRTPSNVGTSQPYPAPVSTNIPNPNP